MKLMSFTSRARVLISAFALVALTACVGIEVERGPFENFDARDFKTYSWKTPPIKMIEGSKDPLYTIGPAIRAEVNEILSNKGYREQASGGEFVVAFEFLTEYTQGQLPKGASNIDPVPQVVLNRGMGQAEVDNAFALSGVQEKNHVLIQFEDGADQGTLWQGSVAKIVENQNYTDQKKMRKSIRRAMDVVFVGLPAAGN